MPTSLMMALLGNTNTKPVAHKYNTVKYKMSIQYKYTSTILPLPMSLLMELSVLKIVQDKFSPLCCMNLGPWIGNMNLVWQLLFLNQFKFFGKKVGWECKIQNPFSPCMLFFHAFPQTFLLYLRLFHTHHRIILKWWWWWGSWQGVRKGVGNCEQSNQKLVPPLKPIFPWNTFPINLFRNKTCAS